MLVIELVTFSNNYWSVMTQKIFVSYEGFFGGAQREKYLVLSNHCPRLLSVIQILENKQLTLLIFYSASIIIR